MLVFHSIDPYYFLAIFNCNPFPCTHIEGINAGDCLVLGVVKFDLVYLVLKFNLDANPFDCVMIWFKDSFLKVILIGLKSRKDWRLDSVSKLKLNQPKDLTTIASFKEDLV